jgi:hypothetical protein
MIDREHPLSVARQAKLLDISRGAVYPRRNLPSSIASALAMLLGLPQAKKSINLQLGLPSF